MSANIIKLDYGKAEDTIKIFYRTVQQLDDTLKEVKAIAHDIEGGILLGQGGQELTRVILDILCPGITKISEKFQRTAKDLQGAMQDMKQADAESRQQFSV